MEYQFTLLLWLPVFLAIAAIGIYFVLRRLSKKPLPPPGPTLFNISLQNLNIAGIRYQRDESPVMVLLHGYSGNSRNWREIGHELHRRGYDVWMPNFRGHGNGEHRSHVLSSEKGCYGFTQMVLEDVPGILEHIRNSTGKKVCLVAHSMGGIAARAFLSGAVEENGSLSLEKEIAMKRASQLVIGLVLVGSPPHFHQLPQSLKWIMRQPSQLKELLHSAMPASIGGHTPTNPDPKGLPHKVVKVILSQVSKTLTKTNPIRGVAELGNFNTKKKEFTRLMEKGISKVHTDLIEDMSRWVNDGEVTIMGTNLSRARPLFVPILFIAGELDLLAPASEIFKSAKSYGGMTDSRTVLVKSTSHVDLISGERAAKLLGPILDDFAQDPGNLGPPGAHLELS